MSPSSRPTVALIGANGFIGLRTVEMLAGRPDLDLVPLVRSPASLAVIARRALAWRITSFTAEAPLATALKGCAVCVHAAIGDAAQIMRMAEVSYRACAAAGVRRLVWLSSASVHGQNCPPLTDETSPLHEQHPLVYNNAKVRAELALQRLARDGRVEVIMLRPGVVFGPRSRWITDAARELREGRAAWLDGGRGICNSIYVDNLVEAVRLAALAPKPADQAFLVGDAETVTWREFLLPIATHLGLAEDALHEIPAPDFAPEKESRLTALTLTPAYGRLGNMIPDRAKRLVKGLARAWPTPPPARSAWTPRLRARAPGITQELALLQQCAWKLPHARAAAQLGYAPPVAFAEGLRRSLAWLDFVEGRA
jgi:nucleoside-diphosphate-sugar epimerase